MDEIMIKGMISTVKFNKVADNRIIYDVKSKNLTVEFLFLQDEKENKEVQKIQR